MTTLALLEAARARLAEADAPREGLGELVQPRRLLGMGRAPRIVPVGEAWHIGVLLLTDAAVLATGEILRSRQGAPRGFTAEAQRERAERAAAAFRGGFAEGATVHVGWTTLDPAAVDAGTSSGPLRLVDGIPSVRWSAAAGYTPLAGYLDERVGLLLEPPLGA